MIYQNLKIYPNKRKISDEWFIYWEVLNEVTGDWEGRRRRGGINQANTREGKELRAAALLIDIKAILDAGGDPYTVIEMPKTKNKLLDPGSEYREMKIIPAIEWAFEKHRQHLNPTTIESSKSHLKKVYAAIRACGFDSLDLSEFKKAHARIMFDKITASPTTKNAILIMFNGCMKELIRVDAFEVSPLYKFGNFQTGEKKQRRILTQDEQKRIYDYFEIHKPEFNNVFQLIYYTSIRFSEIAGLQIKDYHPNEREFVIVPETYLHKGRKYRKNKVDVTRNVHIPPQMFKIMQGLVLGQYPQDYFIFGQGLKPGPMPMLASSIRKWWYSHVNGTLGIPVTPYATKHKGLQDKRKAGVSQDATMFQPGHTSYKTTKIYTDQAEREILKKEIDDKQPDFHKK